MATVSDFSDAALGLIQQWGTQKLAAEVRPAPPAPAPMPAAAPAPATNVPTAAYTAAANDIGQKLSDIVMSPTTWGLVFVVGGIVYLVRRRRG